jgi:DNA-binding GntR family transcriptional regulator
LVEPFSVTTASVAEEIMKVIREAIMSKRLVPGQRYSVEQVASELNLGVSRTPVREALVRLADTGMVRFERNRGVRILQPSVPDMAELYQLRLMVEVPAAYRAARKADQLLIYKLETTYAGMQKAAEVAETLHRSYKAATDPTLRAELSDQLDQVNLDFVNHDILFHELVIGAGGNQRLVAAVRSWRDMATTMGGWRFAQSGAALSEHKPILEALKQADPAAAGRAMRNHLIEAGNLLMTELRELLPDGGDFDSSWHEGVAVPDDTTA